MKYFRDITNGDKPILHKKNMHNLNSPKQATFEDYLNFQGTTLLYKYYGNKQHNNPIMA